MVEDCSIVYQQLLIGKFPEKSCGYVGGDPIVCCPIHQSTSTTPKPVSQPDMVQSLSNRSIVAQASKCKNSLFSNNLIERLATKN